MNNDHIAVFESTVHKTHEWVSDVTERLDITNRHEGYRALRAVLHALRDQLDVDECAEFAAQMPMLVRGMYFEGWVPSRRSHVRSADAFLDVIVSNHGARPYKKPEEMAVAVLDVLRKHMSDGEIDEVLQRLPESVRRVFAANVST